MKTRMVLATVLFLVGLSTSLLGLTLAGSLGHRVALALGMPTAWFDVDFNHPSAIWIAAVLEIGIVLVGYVVVGTVAGRVASVKRSSLFAAANPAVWFLAFLAYKVLKPLGPEHAYLSPEAGFLTTIAFPLFFCGALAGHWFGPRRRVPPVLSAKT